MSSSMLDMKIVGTWSPRLGLPLFLVLMLAELVPGSARTFREGSANHEESSPPGSAFVQSLVFRHQLRLCNAYTGKAAFDLFDGNLEKLSDQALAYKTCRDFHFQLQEGDKLHFRAGNVDAATFSVGALPRSDAVLLLILARRDAESAEVAFESHVFAKVRDAQVAVIDTYRGPEGSALELQDAAPVTDVARSAGLRYGSVFAMGSGSYKCVLFSEGGDKVTEAPFNAEPGGNYVVLRVGGGDAYAQDLVVFPGPPTSLVSGFIHRAFVILRRGSGTALGSMVSAFGALAREYLHRSGIVL